MSTHQGLETLVHLKNRSTHSISIGMASLQSSSLPMSMSTMHDKHLTVVSSV